MKNKTHEEYVNEVANTNPNIEVIEKYVNAMTPIKHLCKIDGNEWMVRPNGILRGNGCPICGQNKRAKSKTKTNEEYIKEVSKINPNIEVIGTYAGARTKILHKCKKCGYEWYVKPDGILHSRSCPNCAGNIKNTHEEYVEKLAKINPNIEVIGTYINSATSILHKCKIDGYEWFARPNDFISGGNGCPKCSRVLRPTQQEYVERVKAINKDIEVLGEYITNNIKILHKCKKCQCEWYADPSHIMRGRGCPQCNLSHGETAIDNYLTEHDIDRISQYKFQDCCNKMPLPFDFYLPDYNCCIEYDGIQHFEPVEIFGGIEKLEYTKYNDTIKTKYCKDNNILLLRIKYDDDIVDILNNFFNNTNNDRGDKIV